MSRERDKNPSHVIALLRTVIAAFKHDGVTQVSVDDLEQAVDKVEADRAH